MTRPLPRRLRTSGDEERDRVNGMAELLEWLGDACVPEPGRPVSLLHVSDQDAVELSHRLSERIYQHNDFHVYPFLRNCVETILEIVGRPLGSIMQEVRNALDARPRDTDVVVLRTSLVEEARTAARILRRHTRPTLAERAAALSGQPKPPATGPAAAQPETTADPSPEVSTTASAAGGNAEGVGQPAVPVQAEPAQQSHLAPDTPAIADDDALLSPASLAKRFGIPADALRTRLNRWRKKNHDGWIENTERSGQEAQYVYRVGAVRHIIEAMKATS